MPRYVVLHHTGYGPPHYDVMIERDADGPLRSWRSTTWPPTDGSLTPNVDHRRHYLAYEGPVSGGRGEVRRIDHGVAATEDDDIVLHSQQGELNVTLPQAATLRAAGPND